LEEEEDMSERIRKLEIEAGIGKDCLSTLRPTGGSILFATRPVEQAHAGKIEDP
jgi:hypothetical protein